MEIKVKLKINYFLLFFLVMLVLEVSDCKEFKLIVLLYYDRNFSFVIDIIKRFLGYMFVIV